ncbi:MAG: hypothetical protein K2J71_08530 [Oscillospiraceae bacterium]|nr:hypothetical protein [Oscillospiraceae bacterium]
MSKKNQKKKSRKQKSRKSLAIGEEYVIRYCSGERFVVLVACIFVCMCSIAVSVCLIVNKEEFWSVLFLVLLLTVPLVLAVVFMFRFRIRFQSNQRELEIRKLFGKTKKISLNEIQEIYYSTDGRVNFLNIITESTKIHVNTSACENTQFLKIFLRTHCEHKFKTGIRKEVHLL